VTAAVIITPHSVPIRNMRLIFLFTPSLISLSVAMDRAVDFAVPLRSYSCLALLDKRFSAHFPIPGIEARHQASSLLRCYRRSNFNVHAIMMRLIEFPIIQKRVSLSATNHEFTRMDTNVVGRLCQTPNVECRTSNSGRSHSFVMPVPWLRNIRQ